MDSGWCVKAGFVAPVFWGLSRVYSGAGCKAAGVLTVSLCFREV